MSPRQRSLYVHRFSLWRPVLADTSGVASDPGFATTPDYTDVVGYFESTPNVNEPHPQGLQKQTNFLTNDRIHLLLTQEIASGWLVKMTSDTRNSNNPAVGAHWVVQGDPDANARRADKQSMQVVYTPQPNFTG